jgi:hypothetical protein
MVEAQTSWFGDGLCTSGDHERGLLAPFYHCSCPRGDGVFLPSHNKIHDTHTHGCGKRLQGFLPLDEFYFTRKFWKIEDVLLFRIS